MHPLEVGKERRRYFRLFGELFGLLVPKQIVSGFESEVQGAGGTEEERVEGSKTDGASEEVSLEVSSMEGREQTGAGADAGGGIAAGDQGGLEDEDALLNAAGNSGAAQVEAQAEAHGSGRAGLDTIETPAGLLYSVATPVDMLVRQIVPEPKPLDFSEEAIEAAAQAAEEAAAECTRMEEKAAAAQAVLDGETEAEEEGTKAKGKKKKLSAEEEEAAAAAKEAQEAEARGVIAEVEQWRQERAEAEAERLRLEKATYDPVPRDRDGCSCIEVLHVPLELVADFITGARGELILRNEKLDKERMDTVTELCSTRRSTYTDELEERLRVHWPRKGRTDVKFYQPREGELNGHEQRHQRHVRATLKKNQVHMHARHTCTTCRQPLGRARASFFCWRLLMHATLIWGFFCRYTRNNIRGCCCRHAITSRSSPYHSTPFKLSYPCRRTWRRSKGWRLKQNPEERLSAWKLTSGGIGCWCWWRRSRRLFKKGTGNCSSRAFLSSSVGTTM